MPLAVDCTTDLIRCKILDMSGNVSSHELVLSYGLALVRFVNLITERKQKIFYIPLRRLAKEMNIPVWVVDLRHDLTHGKLPQLNACRKGCDVVLEWLRRTYWSCQLGNNLSGECEEEQDEEAEMTAVTETEMDSDTEEAQDLQPQGYLKDKEFHEKVRNVLISYRNQQFGVFQEFQPFGKAQKVWCNPSSEVEWILAQIKDLVQENRDAVAEVLLEDGFLIPTVEHLDTLNIKSDETKELLDVPQLFYCFWQPLLKGLHSQDFTQALIEKMFANLKQCSESSELRSQYLINWIAELLTASTKVKARKKMESCYQSQKRKLFLRRIPLQWLKLIDNCLGAPCWATPHLLRLILTGMEPPLPSDTQKNLLYLSSIYTQEGSSLSSPGSSSDTRGQPIYTIESLQWKARQVNLAKVQGQMAKRQETVLGGGEDEEEGEEGDEEEEEMETESPSLEELLHPVNTLAVAEKRAALQGSVWQISSDEVQWKDFPLGKLPGQADEPDGLMVEHYSVMSLIDQPMTRDERHSPSMNSSELDTSVTEGLLWTQSDLHRIKSGLQLF
ncbi:ribosomal biogenesis protein LAS1L isoform X3 [Alligator mississippiensis]|nr:ribosomal biogenesis protein LAS1L isoform X3 [Alligator mississippiensis]